MKKNTNKNIYYDNKSRPWVRSLNKPKYSIPVDINNGILSTLTRNCYQDDEIQQFLVFLPYYTYPMWLKDEYYIKSLLDYSYCVCVECGKFVNKQAQLCLSFIVVQHIYGDCSIAWSTRLTCCKEIHYGLSSYFLISEVEDLLKNIFFEKTTTFDDRFHLSKTHCYVCEDVLPCKNEICKYVFKRLSFKQTAADRMFNLTAHLIEKKADIITPLRENICCTYGCGIKMTNVPCSNCKRVAYCSKKCKQNDRLHHLQNGCINSLKIFNW